MPYFDPRQLNRAGMYSGLLRQPRGGINLLGMNLPAGRNTLVARPDDAPNAAAASAIRGYVGRNASPQRRSVQNIFGAPRGVTDILGRLNPQKYGPVMEGPQKYGIGKGGPDRFRSPIVSQDLARQMAAVAGIPAPTAMGGANVLAEGAGQFLGRRGEGLPMTARPTEGDAPEGPQSFMGKIGGFLKRPGVGESMMAAGARMMQGSPEGTLATIGYGAERGLEAYGQAKTARQLEEDRAVEAEERARKTTAREGLQSAISAMIEAGELTEEQGDIATNVALSDPAAAQGLIQKYTAENQTGNVVTSFLEGLTPDVREKLEAYGQAAWLEAPNSVVSPDQKFDIMMTHGMEAERQENAIDSLLWKLHNIDDRTKATPEQLEQAQFISRNPEYTETMLRSPLNWDVIDLGDKVQYWRDDVLIRTMPKAEDDPIVPSALMEGFEEFYNLERDAGRAELYQWKRGIDAVDRMTDEMFGLKTKALRRAWIAFQDHITDGGDRGAGLATLEGAWAALGFGNLSSFVGPTSDYEFGIAQAISGSRDLTRADLKKHMVQLYRLKLDRIAEHNDRLLSRVPDEEMRESLLIRLAPEDFHTETRRYYDDRLGSAQSTPGHKIMLSGVRSWTGAYQDLGPDRVPKPGASVANTPLIIQDPDPVLGQPGQQNGLLNGPAVSPSGGGWERTGEERGFGNPLQRNMFKWEQRDEFGRLLDTKWIKDEDVPWVN